MGDGRGPIESKIEENTASESRGGEVQRPVPRKRFGRGSSARRESLEYRDVPEQIGYEVKSTNDHPEPIRSPKPGSNSHITYYRIGIS